MVIKSCLSQTTAHGLANIVNEPYKSGRYMWFFLTIAVLSGFLYHSFLLYSQFQEEQVSASTHPNSIPFIQPDIVFCSERILARDIINNPPKDEYELMLNVSKVIQNIDKWYRNLPYKSSVFIWDSINLHELFKAFFHRREEFFLSIVCNFKEVDVNKLTVEMNIVHLACYRLTPDICSLRSPMNSLIIKFYNHIQGTKVNYKALNVSIDGRPIDSYLFAQKEYVDEMEDGVHIYFVQPNELIHKSSRRVNASPNMHTDIRITSTRYEHISTKKFHCKDQDSYKLVYNLLEEDRKVNHLNLTKSSLCVYENVQRILYKSVKCVSSQFPIPIDIPSNFTFCGSNNKSNDLKKYVNFIQNALQINNLVMKNCINSIPCTSIKHKTIVSYGHWPRTSSLRSFIKNELAMKLQLIEKNNLTSPGLFEMFHDFQKNPSKVELWKKNLIKVSISPDEFMSTEVFESQTYSFKNFFSDTGGILGFYLGVSILTLCELFRLIHYTINRMVERQNKDLQNNSSFLQDNNV